MHFGLFILKSCGLRDRRWPAFNVFQFIWHNYLTIYVKNYLNLYLYCISIEDKFMRNNIGNCADLFSSKIIGEIMVIRMFDCLFKEFCDDGKFCLLDWLEELNWPNLHVCAYLKGFLSKIYLELIKFWLHQWLQTSCANIFVRFTTFKNRTYAFSVPFKTFSLKFPN